MDSDTGRMHVQNANKQTSVSLSSILQILQHVDYCTGAIKYTTQNKLRILNILNFLCTSYMLCVHV